MKKFEIEIIRQLLLDSDLEGLLPILDSPRAVVEFSGVGYFITVRNYRLPTTRRVLDSLDMRGKLGGVEVGYLAFIEASELTLECYSYGDEINSTHREKGFVQTAT